MFDVVLACQSQLRVAPSGQVLGLDMSVALQMADAMGLERGAAAELLPWAEVGLREALKEAQSSLSSS
ncbi:DUF7697 family protein [Magnetofaba australis]|uniref:DUF7697 family protein n=1 Tax=Magnetofaba australis TaxID=1472297 RepID=UPI000A19D29B|nr:hypothetical protein [Magnetofaba australis]